MNYSATKDSELSLKVGNVINDLRRTDREGFLEVGRLSLFKIDCSMEAI